jgi:predicted nucleic acid-binding protein
MILADTSVWIEHFRHGLPVLAQRLVASEIACHPVVLGELAAGNLHQRARTLALLQRLPRVAECTSQETLDFLESHSLHGRGLGWSDLQILAAAHAARLLLWTLDRRLAEAASSVGLRAIR